MPLLEHRTFPDFMRAFTYSVTGLPSQLSIVSLVKLCIGCELAKPKDTGNSIQKVLSLLEPMMKPRQTKTMLLVL